MRSPVLKVISKKPREAFWHAQYLWRTPQSGVQNRNDLLAHGCGNLPAWAGGCPFTFFSASDANERKNGCAARCLILTLPIGQSLAQWEDLVLRFIAQDLGGKPYLYAIHSGVTPFDKPENPHVHILYSDRLPDQHEREATQYFRRYNPAAPERGGCKKDSGGKSLRWRTIEISQRRAMWARLQEV